VATALILLVLGVFSGRMIETGKNAGEGMAELRTEISEMRELLTVALMNQSSALERLQGVVMSRGLSTSGSDIPSALIRRLNNDPNVSVRIAAAEALGQYRDHSWVRGELISSLSHQTSPLVQVSLMELLTHMKEEKAAEVFEAIIDNETTMEPVRKTARIGLDNLI
jgi:Sec-independent protein translocase protein TatA